MMCIFLYFPHVRPVIFILLDLPTWTNLDLEKVPTRAVIELLGAVPDLFADVILKVLPVVETTDPLLSAVQVTFM